MFYYFSLTFVGGQLPGWRGRYGRTGRRMRCKIPIDSIKNIKWMVLLNYFLIIIPSCSYTSADMRPGLTNHMYLWGVSGLSLRSRTPGSHALGWWWHPQQLLQWQCYLSSWIYDFCWFAYFLGLITRLPKNWWETEYCFSMCMFPLKWIWTRMLWLQTMANLHALWDKPYSLIYHLKPPWIQVPCV